MSCRFRRPQRQSLTSRPDPVRRCLKTQPDRLRGRSHRLTYYHRPYLRIRQLCQLLRLAPLLLQVRPVLQAQPVLPVPQALPVQQAPPVPPVQQALRVLPA